MSELIDLFSQSDNWVALFTLALLEIVLGIDNIVFIAILTAKLPKEQHKLAYNLGLGAAMVSRIALLFAISWVMHLTEPLATVMGIELSGRSLILLGGGAFLIAKASHEIFEKVEGVDETKVSKWSTSLVGVVLQIMVLDIVFSLDSVITAVGMVDHLPIMIAAIVVAMLVMLMFARPIGEFVNEHPSMKILALSFLMLVGVLLVAEGAGQHIEKGYVYFAMLFAVVIELLNMRFRKRHPDEYTSGSSDGAASS